MIVMGLGFAPILVWQFGDAPEWLQKLCDQGGDEQWVALVPRGQPRPPWAESGTAFGACTVTRHEVGDESHHYEYALVGCNS